MKTQIPASARSRQLHGVRRQSAAATALSSTGDDRLPYRATQSGVSRTAGLPLHSKFYQSLTAKLRRLVLGVWRFSGCWILVLGAFCPTPSNAQTNDSTVSVPDLIQSAQQWANQNLDTNVANAISQIDPTVVDQFYHDFTNSMQGDSVVDVASVRTTAQTVLPLLQSRPETQPLAAWLNANMDYLDIAEQIREAIPPPQNPTNPAPAVLNNPPPQKEREIWIKHQSRRPWPPAATEYVTELKPVFAAQNVPPQLVWVAEVESSFDREAESPAGAAGLFQLMPDTAKRFGLSLWWRDQRYQAIPSAEASAKYFKYLYSKFHDWRLVMAAYNAGEGTVERLLVRHKTHNYDNIAPYLPAETQMYVPRIEAVLMEREGARLEELAPPQA